MAPTLSVQGSEVRVINLVSHWAYEHLLRLHFRISGLKSLFWELPGRSGVFHQRSARFGSGSSQTTEAPPQVFQPCSALTGPPF